MCQLLGMNSSAAASIRFSFTGYAQRGGCTADHIDGWGIAFYEPSGARSFLDDRPASESRLAAFVRDLPIRSHNVISHIRKATQGSVGLCNTHPFPRAPLVDCDLSVDLGELNGPDDRTVIVATEPLTSDEAWERLRTGDTRVFVGGQPVSSHHDARTRRFPVP